MARFLIDANLPYRFSLWAGSDYLHVYDIDDKWPDMAIWGYAKDNDLTIVSKDADFSDMVMLDGPPPRVVHVKVGNMKLRDLHAFLHSVWDEVCKLSETHRLVRLYVDRIEVIE